MKSVLAAAVLLLAAGCGGTSPASVPATTPTPTPTPVATPTRVPLTGPTAIAKAMARKIRPIGKITTMTEKNDDNNLIGRPGKYDAAAGFLIAGLCREALDTTCGGKIERWGSRGDAELRVKDIQAKLKNFGLGAEYDYVSGGLVLRLAGDVKPSQAKRYESVFHSLVDPNP